MKRILSIVAVLALVFALAVPAIAAEKVPSVIGDEFYIKITDSNEKPSDADIGSGNKLLGVWDATLWNATQNRAATEDEVKQYFAGEPSIPVDFSAQVGNANIVKVLHKVNGTWKTETHFGATVAATSLSPFAFIVKADSSNDNNVPGNNNKKSPQTGYNTILWAISAAAMVACAGYCFASARKKAAE